MAAPLLATAGKAAAAIAPAATTGLFGWIGAKRARKFSREAATTAYQRDMDMWDKTNKYNAPEAQMQRLKEAGLNPNMIYGHGSSSSTGQASSSMPKHQNYEQPAYTGEGINPMQILAQFADLKGKVLSNDAQAISNQYLEEQTHSKTRIYGNTAEEGRIRNMRTKGKPSLYQSKYQNEVKQSEQNTILKNFDIEFYKSMPKTVQKLLPLIMRFTR